EPDRVEPWAGCSLLDAGGRTGVGVPAHAGGSRSAGVHPAAARARYLCGVRPVAAHGRLDAVQTCAPARHHTCMRAVRLLVLFLMACAVSGCNTLTWKRQLARAERFEREDRPAAALAVYDSLLPL